jgi:transcriptional regulator with XRE-family HTH domain
MKNTVYSDEYDRLRKWLKSQREIKKLTHRQLADILGRHHSIVGKIEQSRRKIDIIEFLEFCDALDADPHQGIDFVLTKPK